MGYPGVRESVNISDINSSVTRVLERYARGPRFESLARLDSAPAVTFKKVCSAILFIFPRQNSEIKLKITMKQKHFAADTLSILKT